MDYIEFKEVKKQYQVGEVAISALSDCSFTIQQGEFVVVLGPSGAGKTTLLNLLGGMDTVSDGEIWVDQHCVSQQPLKSLVAYRREAIGFVFQFYNLIENLTALENVEIACQFQTTRAQAAKALEDVGLSARMDHFPSQLSGGEQQRVSIARALAKQPKLLLCDEPTGALDSETGKRIIQLLHQHCRQQQLTTVLITHNAEIAKVADKIIHVLNGKVASVETQSKPQSIEAMAW